MAPAAERPPAASPEASETVAVVGLAVTLPGVPDLHAFAERVFGEGRETMDTEPAPAAEGGARQPFTTAGETTLDAVSATALADLARGGRERATPVGSPDFTRRIGCTCASGACHPLAALSALGEAREALLSRRARTAVVAAACAGARHHPRPAPDDIVRAYAADAGGGAVTAGAAAVALKRLSDALADGDRVYAILGAIAIGDSRRGGAEAGALHAALAAATASPESVTLVEGHGSGVGAEDTAEITALREVLGHEGWPGVTLGSLKSAWGDAGAAAALLGVVKTALALDQRVLPGTGHVSQPHPLLARGRIVAATRARPWLAGTRGVRRAAVLAREGAERAGAVLLGEGPEQTPRERLVPCPAELVLLAAAEKSGLVARLEALIGELEAAAPPSLGILARRACARFDPGSAERLAVVATSLGDLRDKLARAALRLGHEESPSWSERDGLYRGFGSAPGKIAFLYGGLGFPGLTGGYGARLGELHVLFPEVRRRVERVDAMLEDDGGAYPFRHQLYPPAPLAVQDLEQIEKELAMSRRTGPGMFAAYLAGYELLDALGVKADMHAGFSLGEWAAVLAGGIVAEEEFQDLVRAEDMHGGEGQDEGPQGTWAMVAASAIRVEEVLGGLALPVSVTVDLTPDQVFIGGESQHLAKALAALRSAGIWAQEAPFMAANPLHTPMTEPYRVELHRRLAKLPVHPARVPVYCSVTAAPYPADADGLRWELGESAFRTVRLHQTVRRMYEDGARVFVQLGSGGKFLGLIRSTLPLEPHVAVSIDLEYRGGYAQLLHLLARLAAEGVKFDPARLSSGRPMAEAPAGAAETAARAHPFVAAQSLLQEFLVMERRHDGEHRRVMEHFLAVHERAVAAFLAPGAAPAAGAAPRPSFFHFEEFGRDSDGTALLRVVLDLGRHAFLRDHALIKGPDTLLPLSTRLATLPMTFGIEILAEAAARLWPQRTITEVKAVEALRWISLVDVERLALVVRVADRGDGEAEVDIRPEGDKLPALRGRVVLGAAPATAGATALESPSLRPCAHQARDLYLSGRMFHGPTYRVLSALAGFHDDGIEATCTTGDPCLWAEGAAAAPLFDAVLLDAMGQAIGYRGQIDGETLYPVGLERVRLLAATPPAGTLTRVVAQRRRVEGRRAVWDVDAILPSGAPWLRVEGWHTWRLLWPEQLRFFYYNPRSGSPGRRLETGVREAVVVVMSRDMLGDMRPDWLARFYLTPGENDRWRARGSRLDSLLGLMAAKDAVREALLARDGAARHPLEVRIEHTPGGAPRVAGVEGQGLAISVAHVGDEAVAVAIPGAAGVGIDLVRVEERGPGFTATVLDGDEQALIAALPAQEQRAWIHRAFAAKEAAMKSFGDGLEALPRYRARSFEPASGSVVVATPGASLALAVRTWEKDGRVISLAVRAPAAPSPPH